MARRSSGRSAPRPSPRPAPRPVSSQRSSPPAAHNAPPPAPAQTSGGGSMLGGLAGTIAQGLAFGTGSAVAHRAVDGIMGPRVVQHEHVEAEAPAALNGPSLTTVGAADSCGNHSKSFQDCLNAYGSDISKCQFYLDMLNECRRSTVSSSVTM